MKLSNIVESGVKHHNPNPKLHVRLQQNSYFLRMVLLCVKMSWFYKYRDTWSFRVREIVSPVRYDQQNLGKFC